MKLAVKLLGVEVVLLLLLCLVNGNVVPQLRAVSMLFRHGSRSPIGTYPLDPYKDYPWPGGFGALLPKGAEEMFQAGLIRAGRYSSLIADCMYENCNITNKIVVKSSSSQRCVDSAENFLDAFLPVPVPDNLIYVIPEAEDEMLAFPGKSCPKYANALYYVRFNYPGFSGIIDFQSQKGQEILTYIEDNTGLNITSPLLMITLGDTLLVQQLNGLELPAWTDSVYEQYIKPLGNAALDILSNLDYMSVRMGTLLDDMVEQFECFSRGTSEQNMLVYSAHDLTLMGMINELGIADQTQIRPQYGSQVAFELYDNPTINKSLEIRIFYWSTFEDSNPLAINIPGCAAPCAFEDFVRTVRSKLTKNYEKQCRV